MNVHNFAVFDTETVGLSPKLIYDLALIICNRAGEPIVQKAWLIREVITDAKKMKDAFYSGKTFSHYIPALDAGALKLFSFADARLEFNSMIAKYNAKTIVAYNIQFDKAAIKETTRHIGEPVKFLHKKIHFVDLWLASCRILVNTNKYRKFCADHNFISDAGNVRTSAETVYAYVKQNPNFRESHTALEDCIIESEILGAINKRKRGLPRNEINYMPWKIPQRKINVKL